MDIVSAAISQRRELTEIGKAALNIKYPDEFELYLIALELVSPKEKKTLQYFVFPVMPNSLSETERFGTNIIKTAGGIVAISNTTFIPINISLSGSFGRKLKYLVGAEYVNLVQGFSLKKLANTKQLIKKAVFDTNIKTGYGCCKVLQNILRESKLIDEDGPRILYYHNLTFNSKFIVKADEIAFSQEVGSSNMIWNYRLSLTAIANAVLLNEDSQSNVGNLTVISSNFIQKLGGKVIDGVGKYLRRT